MPIRDDELKSLKDMILKMASLVESAIRDSVRSLIESNAGLAQSVIENDHIVNALDVNIDEECIRLIARRQPMGRDLRFLTTGMKITTDLERIADHAVNIAEKSVILMESPPIMSYSEISRMREITQMMVKDAIDSFVNEDKALSVAVINRDDEVDDLNDTIIDGLLSIMTHNPDSIIQASQLIYISRNLERIADHSTNISEVVIYMVEGKIVRHMADISHLKA
ncbi:MAG: phosphate signaling complex protein PhoU [Nitrospirae bacterium]|nr:phosphate signaling complex protein PhoU [Nitrospirota bacterium]MBF0536556.1 phosphate signaling complex protein PhoU [Nitrospirota bacterium]MBF0618471.1 phosphate signaling complex protein PhoU [Nitrospirota bacterium]